MNSWAKLTFRCLLERTDRKVKLGLVLFYGMVSTVLRKTIICIYLASEVDLIIILIFSDEQM